MLCKQTDCASLNLAVPTLFYGARHNCEQASATRAKHVLLGPIQVPIEFDIVLKVNPDSAVAPKMSGGPGRKLRLLQDFILIAAAVSHRFSSLDYYCFSEA